MYASITAMWVAIGCELNDDNLGTILAEFQSSDTGLALFWGDEQVTAVAPPFPLKEDIYSEGTDISLASAAPRLSKTLYEASQ